MKLKNFLLGASLAMCGAAFAQPAGTQYRIYYPEDDVTLWAAACNATTDDDGNTTVTADVLATQDGGAPGSNDPAGKWYLGYPGGFSSTDPNFGGVCSNTSSQCIWICPWQ